MVFLAATLLTSLASLMLIQTGGLTAWRLDDQQRSIDPSIKVLKISSEMMDLLQSIQQQTNDIQMLTKDAAKRLNKVKKVI